MTARWSGLASNATAGNRLLNIGMCATHLSTGDLIMLVWDPSLTKPNQLTLQVVTGHTSPSVVGFLSQDIFQAGVLGSGGGSGFPQSLAMCRDASDNIYVVGAYNQSPYGFEIVAQAFVKSSGLAWTQQASSFTHSTGAITYPTGFSAVWCNTLGGPGGVGHILVIADNLDGTSRYQILSVNSLLNGFQQSATAWGTSPAFISSGVANPAYAPSCGSNIDLDANGFGATSGLAINTWALGSATAGSLLIGGWGVSSSGILTGPGGLQGIRPAGVLSGSTKAMIVNYGNNRWAAIYPSGTNAGQLTVTGLTGSGLAAGGTGFSAVAASSVDTGTPTNFPLPSATLSWGAIAGPANASTVWIYGWSTAANTTMLRLPVTFTASGIPSINPAQIVTDDTSVGAATNSTIRVVDDVVDFLHADWQAFDTVSGTLSLLGDYSALPAAPAPVTLVSPVNNASVPAAGTYTWTYNPAFPGDVQATYYFRNALQPGGSYRYWNGSGMQSTEIAVTSAVSSVTFPSGQFTIGSIYSWSIDVTGSSGIRAGYASPQFVGIAHPSPSNPTLTASWDAPSNTTTLTLHSGDSTGINGSIEYTDDGVTWYFVRNGTQLTVSPGTATLVDYEVIPGVRQYRARSWTIRPYGYSAYVTQSITASTTVYKLGDPTSQSAASWMTINVMEATFSTHYAETLTVHTLLGRTRPVTLSDVIMGEDGGCTIWTHTDIEDAQFLSLVLSQKTLMLISPEGKSWYIRINAPRTLARPIPGAHDRYREYALTWNQVNRP